MPGYGLIEPQQFVGFRPREAALMRKEMQPGPFVPMYGREGVDVHGTTLAPQSAQEVGPAARLDDAGTPRACSVGKAWGLA